MKKLILQALNDSIIIQGSLQGDIKKIIRSVEIMVDEKLFGHLK